jgi:protein TonB
MRRAILGSLLIHAAAFGAALFAFVPGGGRDSPAVPGIRVDVVHAPAPPEPRWVPPDEPAPLPPVAEPETPWDPPEPPLAPFADRGAEPPSAPPEPPPSSFAYRLKTPLRRFEAPAPPELPAPAPSARAPGPLLPPRRIATAVATPYPERARARGIEGRVLLRLHVSAAGDIADAVVTRSSGHAILDDAALRGARALRFEPARRDGRAVACWIPHAVEFRLTD